MAGINLSQGGEVVRREAGFFDRGTVASILLLSLTLAFFGGLRWYISSLEARSLELDQTLAAKQAEISGDRVDRLADFDSRLKYTEQVKKTDSNTILQELEKSIIAPTALTTFTFNQPNNEVSFAAVSPSFKELAQQIQTLKTGGSYSNIQVSEIERREEGGIEFTVKASLQANKK